VRVEAKLSSGIMDASFLEVAQGLEILLRKFEFAVKVLLDPLP